MENDQFDAVVRAWPRGTPRRLVLGLLAGGLVGLASGDQRVVTAKKKKVTLCLNGQTISVKKNKQGALLGQGATRGACAVSPPPPPPRPPTSPPTSPPPPPAVDTCADGVLNGFETDVDCGGTCPNRCRVNRQCARDFDCTTSRCNAGQCTVCENNDQCPENCQCGALAMCFNPTTSVVRDGASCTAACPPRTGTCTIEGPNRFRCFPYCGEVYPA